MNIQRSFIVNSNSVNRIIWFCLGVLIGLAFSGIVFSLDRKPSLSILLAAAVFVSVFCILCYRSNIASMSSILDKKFIVMGVPEDLERGPIEVGAKTALEAINIYSEMKKASYTRILIIDDAGNLVDIRTLFDGI